MPGYCLLQWKEEEEEHLPLRHTHLSVHIQSTICTHKRMTIKVSRLVNVEEFELTLHFHSGKQRLNQIPDLIKQKENISEDMRYETRASKDQNQAVKS